MDRIFRYLWLIPVAIFTNRVTSILPEYYYFDPFPAAEILDSKGIEVGITLQSYVYMISIHLGWIILWLRETLKKDKYQVLFTQFLILELFSLLDFLIRYEQYFFNAGFYKFEFTDIKLALYILAIANWKRKWIGNSNT